MASSSSSRVRESAESNPHSGPKTEQHDFARIPFFDFQPLEPLTRGTNLPEVSPEELSPPEPAPPKSAPAPATPPAEEDSKPTDAPAPATALPGSPPLSPPKPASVRRFLSRVSMNSNYSDDKASVFSGSLAPDGTKKKKKSWWSRKVKRHSMMPAVGGGRIIIPGLEDTATNGNAQRVQAIPPPPRLPDDMFGRDLAALDGDMFSNLRIDESPPTRK